MVEGLSASRRAHQMTSMFHVFLVPASARLCQSALRSVRLSWLSWPLPGRPRGGPVFQCMCPISGTPSATSSRFDHRSLIRALKLSAAPALASIRWNFPWHNTRGPWRSRFRLKAKVAPPRLWLVSPIYPSPPLFPALTIPQDAASRLQNQVAGPGVIAPIWTADVGPGRPSCNLHHSRESRLTALPCPTQPSRSDIILSCNPTRTSKTTAYQNSRIGAICSALAWRPPVSETFSKPLSGPRVEQALGLASQFG
jgi:hypothetical protein